MSFLKAYPSFNAGEISPRLDFRTDLEKHQAGCSLLRNMIPMTYGGVNRRPGTVYQGDVKTHSSKTRLIDFNYSTTTSYIIEIGAGYIRFWTGGSSPAQVQSGGSPYEISSPYTESQLFEVQYAQINDVVYLTHPDVSVRKLSRLADDNWTLEAIAHDKDSWPPLKDENIEDTTITPSATTGTGITLTASADTWTSDHVGSFWQITHRREDGFISHDIAANGESSSMRVLGEWELHTYGTWNADVQIQRSLDGGTSWDTIRTYNSDSDRNVAADGEEERESLLRIKIANYVSNANGRALLEVTDSNHYGLVEVTAYSSATSVTADVVHEMNSTDATKFWSEGAWSDSEGYPRALTLHEQRMYFGGTSGQPNTFWGSVVDDFDNFRRGTNADSSVAFTLASRESNVIQWLVSQGDLLLGTRADEWNAGSGSSENPITPTNIQVRRHTARGSAHLQALVAGESTVFVQRQGRIFREYVYNFELDRHVAPDLTLLSEHITGTGVVQLAYQQQPDSIVWGITNEGKLIGFTYERQQNVVGWHQHETDGDFESVAVIYGDEADEVWVTIKRTIDGATKRYVERFDPDYRDTQDDEDTTSMIYIDSAATASIAATGVIELSSASTDKLKISSISSDTLKISSATGLTASGFDHLEGETLTVLADGAKRNNATVSGGQITLEYTASSVTAGLSYTSKLKPLPLDIQSQGGTSQGRHWKVSQVKAKLLRSLGMQHARDEGATSWDTVPFRGAYDAMDAALPVFTGQKTLYLQAQFDRRGEFVIRSSEPYPMTILALIAKVDLHGE